MKFVSYKKKKKKRGIVLNKAKPLHYVYLQILWQPCLYSSQS